METYIVERTIMFLIRDKYIKSNISSYIIYALRARKYSKIRKEENSLGCKKYGSMKAKLLSEACTNKIAEYEYACQDKIQTIKDILDNNNGVRYYVETTPCTIEVELMKIFCGRNKEVCGMSKHERFFSI